MYRKNIDNEILNEIEENDLMKLYKVMDCNRSRCDTRKNKSDIKQNVNKEKKENNRI